MEIKVSGRLVLVRCYVRECLNAIINYFCEVTNVFKKVENKEFSGI